MSEGMNKVMLLGNLGADPELRVTANGNAVLNMRIATTEGYLDRNNTRQDRTEWHQVALWGKRAESLAKFLAKGERVFIEGRLETTSYEKDGEKRYRTQVVATNVILNGRQKEQREAEPAQPSRAPQRSRAAPSASARDDFDYGGGGADEDIPFVRNETIFGGWGKP